MREWVAGIALLPLLPAAGSATSAVAEEHKPRAIIHYDAEGNVSRQEIDTKATGRMNVWVYFERGQMVRQEEDTVGDGRPHLWSHFREGKLSAKRSTRRARAEPTLGTTWTAMAG